MALESILIALHNVSYWKHCSPSSFIDWSFFLSFPSLSNSPAHKYYLATSPVNSAVYLSDTSSRKVFKVKSLNVVKDVAKNLELVAGTGDQCLPYDDARCGDGGKAVEATLTNPRGNAWILLALLLLTLLLLMECCGFKSFLFSVLSSTLYSWII